MAVAAVVESCSCSSESDLRLGRRCISSWTAVRRLGRRSGNSRTQRFRLDHRPRRCGCTLCLQSQPRSQRNRFRRHGCPAAAMSYSDQGVAACSSNQSYLGACSNPHSPPRRCSRPLRRPACSSGGRCRSPHQGRSRPSRRVGDPTGAPACQSRAHCSTCSCPTPRLRLRTPQRAPHTRRAARRSVHVASSNEPAHDERDRSEPTY
eukprot:COSAG02_NODE_1628_length_11586_cov_3.954644_6_plen_206_part_00